MKKKAVYVLLHIAVFPLTPPCLCSPFSVACSIGNGLLSAGLPKALWVAEFLGKQRLAGMVRHWEPLCSMEFAGILWPQVSLRQMRLPRGGREGKGRGGQSHRQRTVLGLGEATVAGVEGCYPESHSFWVVLVRDSSLLHTFWQGHWFLPCPRLRLLAGVLAFLAGNGSWFELEQSEGPAGALLRGRDQLLIREAEEGVEMHRPGLSWEGMPRGPRAVGAAITFTHCRRLRRADQA